MHDEVELHRLTQWDTRPQPTMSLYLALDHPREGRLQTLGQLIKTKEQKMRSNGSSRWWESLIPDLEQANRFVEELPLGPDRGLVLFSCKDCDKFQAYTLPLLVPNLLEVGPSPYIRPLAALIDDFCRTQIVVLDRRQARFFEGYLGQVEELDHMEINMEAAVQERDGDQGRAGDKRISNRADEAKMRLAKEVNSALLQIMGTHQYRQLLLGGHKGAVEALVPLLHPYLAQRLGGLLSCEANAPLSVVAQTVAEAQAKARTERQEKLMAALAENMGPKGQAASGLNQVLAALFEGKVHTLFVNRGFKAPGGSCPNCGRLRHVAGACPICGEKMTPVEDVVNLAVVRALGSGANMEHVEGNDSLDKMGHIAALLRYA